MLREQLVPKEPRNLQLTAAVSAVMLVAALVAAWLGHGWSPKRGLGLVYGFVAAFLFVLGMLYSWRPLRRITTARNWMQAHAYLGVVAFVAVVLHAGWSWPHGWMGWVLVSLSAWVTLSGLVGVFLQKRLPASLADSLTVEALYERIPELAEQLLVEADTLMDGVSEALESFYLGEVRGRLVGLTPSWGYLLDPRSGRERAVEPFRRRRAFFEAEEHGRVDDLMHILEEKLELDAQYRVQTVLRRWPAWTMHVPAAGVLIGIMFVHILTWILY